MKSLVDDLRKRYDYIVFDLSPLAPVVDVRMTTQLIDSYVFVVEWGRTSQRLVLESLSDASGLLQRVLCVILNKADPAALRSIEHYKGIRFHAYYSDQKRA